MRVESEDEDTMSKKITPSFSQDASSGFQENQLTLKALISSSFDAIIAIDTNKKIILFNKQAEILFGYHESEVIGKSVEPFYQDVKKARKIYQTVLKHGELISEDIVLVHKDGSKIPISISVRLIYDEQGEILGQVGYLNDLSQVRSMKNQLETMIATSKALNTTNDLREILVGFLHSALRAIPSANKGSIHLFDSMTGKLNLFVSSFDFTHSDPNAQSFEVGEGILGWAFEHKEAVKCDDAHADSRYKRVRRIGMKRHRSLLCAPVTGKQQIGVISLSHSQEPRAFSDSDLEILLSFANHTAIVIENSEQIKQTKAVADELEAVRGTSLELNTLIDTEDILMSILNSGNKLLGTEMAVVHWRGRSGENIQTYAVPEALQELKTSPRMKGGLTSEIFQNGELIVVSDTTQDDRVNPQVRAAGIQSLIGFPLPLGGRAAGVLFFNSREHQFFGEHEIQLISRLLPAAAVAIEKADFIERLKETEYLSKALVQVSHDLASKQELNEQLNALKKFLQKELAAPTFYLGLYDPIGDVINLKIHFEAGADQELHEIQLARIKIDTISSFVVRKQEALVWLTAADKRRDCERLGIDPLVIGGKCESCLAFPLLVEDKILGVISIQSPNPNAWNEIEISAFQTLAHQASIAIHNSNLVKEINDALDTLQSSYQASETIISELDPDKALDTLVESICHEFGAFRACALLIDQDGSPYHLSASSGFHENYVLESAYREGGISLKVYQTGVPEFIADQHEQTNLVNPRMVEQGVRASAALPILYQEEKLGVLWLHYKRPRRFTEDDKKAIRLFTNQAAIAYMNAKLHQQVKRANDTTKLVEQMIPLGDIHRTLNTIANGIKYVLGCDIVTLYPYQEENHKFILPPATAGDIRYPEKITSVLQPNTAPYKFLDWEQDVYSSEDSMLDPLLGSPFAERENVKSSAVVKLKSKDKIVGILFINYTGQKHYFSQMDFRDIDHFASQAVVAIQNAVLYEDVRKRKDALKIIDEAGRTVTSFLQLDETLNSLAEQAYKLTGLVGTPAKFSSITLVKGNQTILKAVYPPNEKNQIILANAEIIDIGNGMNGRIGIIGRSVKTKESQLISNVKEDPDYISSHVDTKSELVVPIIYDDQEVIGAINLEHEEIGGLDEDDRKNVSALARHAAVAIHNANLYRSLDRTNRHTKAVYEASKIINASLERTEKELLDLLVEQMVTKIIPGSDTKNLLGAILTYNFEGKELTLAATHPVDAFKDHLIGERRSVGQSVQKIGITGRAALDGKRQRVNDVNENDDYLSYHSETKSEIDVPIMDGDKVLGVLSLESDQLNGFDNEAEDVMSTFAELATIAIQNTRRYRELKETRIMASNMAVVAWMGLVVGAWRHSIGNKATTIFDTTRLAQKDLQKGASNTQINRRLEKIQETVGEIRQVPMPPLSHEDGVENIILYDLVNDRVKQFEHKRRYGEIDYDIKIHIDRFAVVRVSPEWLRRILDILIDNASNAMKTSAVKQITISLKAEDNEIAILVSDTGSGIPDSLIPILTKQPIKKVAGEKGSGIGLFLANFIIQVYGGRLEIHSTSCEGTTIGIWLPTLK